MRVLVTGGAGYIGSVTAAWLLAEGIEVTVLDDGRTGHDDAVPAGARRVSGDVSAPPDEALDGCDAVFHFAASSLVGESVTAPEKYYRNNVCGTLGLLDAMRRTGVGRLVFSSTAAVYGEPEIVPITEDAAVRPQSAYGGSKLAVDQMIGFECAAHGLGAASLRYFNVAGAWGGHGERHDPETHLIPIVLQAAAGTREHVSIYGTDYPTRDGTAVRDYVHVADLANAHLLAMTALRNGEHRVFNLGSGDGFTVREVIEAARVVTDRPIPVVEGPRRAGDPAVLVASSERARSELGWRPERTKLETMIGDAWAFTRG